MKDNSFANRWNAALIEEYYEKWLHEPEQLEPEWRAFFDGFTLAQTQAPQTEGKASLQTSIIGVIFAYRSIGHLQAHLNPLQEQVSPHPLLSLQNLGLEGIDLTQEVHTGNYLGGITLSIEELLHRLQKTYCGSIGCEYLHLQETAERRWLQAKMEPHGNQPNFTTAQKIRILRKICEAEIFERFLHTRYTGQKRFSLEGAETLITSLDILLEKCPELGIQEIVMGMSHRGRLNVLANFFGKSYEFIFNEFAENYLPHTIHGCGDVKYHLGYHATRKTSTGGTVEIHLTANPSHLEAVNPVVEGRARARQRVRDDLKNRTKVLPLLLHGDAAMAGQGIVAEVLNLSKLKGYKTGGTLHIVINNQIGFTTNPTDSRSSRYCTDVAKMIEAPIFHVNGDDPLAVAMVTELALEYRQIFGHDVVIDLYCYRRHGHNEADEPGFTQPILYQQIAKHPPISERFSQQLIAEHTLDPTQLDSIKAEYQDKLTAIFTSIQKEDKPLKLPTPREVPISFDVVDTTVSTKALATVVKALTCIKVDFELNPKIRRQLENKAKLFSEGKGIDWSFAEALAFGTLLLEGIPVRLSGQDSERGTFSQRHSAFYDQKTLERFVPLENIAPHQATFCVHNSSLSEAAVLGFDFGYSIDYPDILCLWEAQFGDFANGAQVIIDQFLSSGYSKWGHESRIVLLLPHGYEGQGPEHSSARIERYLQACAEENLQICNVTTPAQYFHVLRRQMKKPQKKPLIIFSPKSLLRHKECVSSVEELSSGHFCELLDDPDGSSAPERLILCSGKIFYELIAHRKKQECKDVTIIRVEQLYPFHEGRLHELWNHYGCPSTLVWCQEEPQNMGAWSFMEPILRRTGADILFVGRKAAASPATGSLTIHRLEQAHLIEKAFGLTSKK